jgi:hypothetical protein
MNSPVAAVEKIARTCLYEGYLLWPYRRSALKNAKRWTFGGLYPLSAAASFGEPARMRTEVPVETGTGAAVSVQVRFLHVVDRQVYRRCGTGEGLPGPWEPVDRLTVAGSTHLSWQEATERTWTLPPWPPAEPHRRHSVAVPAGTDEEPLHDACGRVTGLLVRSWERLEGSVELDAAPLAEGVARIGVTITNTTPCPLPAGGPRDARDRLAPYALVSTHTVLTADGGSFVSLIDPPPALSEAVASCRNEGTWPVLIGEAPDIPGPDPHRARTVLSSPVTLYDFPAVAPESPGDLFDGGEIDHLLILSVLSLTPDEQREARATDPKAREILDRCSALGPEDLMALRGTIRGPGPVREDA